MRGVETMLLSRAPRQVYRVFDEQEFLAEEWVDALQTSCPEGALRPGGERWHRRLVGAAMLCSAVSAVGGLVVVNCLSPAKGSRRGLDRSLRTAAEAIGPARVSPTHVWRAGMLAKGLGRRSRPGRRVEAVRRTRPGDATTVVTSDVPSAGAVAVADSSGDQSPVGESSDRPRASASAAAASPARAEFGFER
jgi:hypothetical protein